MVTGGLAKNDGDKDDDKVDVKIKKIAVGKLNLFRVKSILMCLEQECIKVGAKGTKDFSASKNNFYVVFKDDRIIDGHHRFLSAVLVDPSYK